MARPDDIEAARVRVMALIGEKLKTGSSATGLLKRMRWSTERPGATRTISNWMRGENGPSFEDAMDMLSEAGLLAPEAEAAWLGSPAAMEKARAGRHHADVAVLKEHRRGRRRRDAGT